MEIISRNVNTLFSDMLWKFKVCGVPAESRNGPVLVINEPVLTRIDRPQERVLFFSGRDANPIFHVMESIWMLAGRRDVHFVKLFNSRIDAYSDNGEYFNAAYGFRMRHHWGDDQLVEVINLLRRDPTTRRAVIQLYDCHDLVNQTSKDHACNTSMMFAIRDGRLELTVTNRSNDAWWGYAGANIVHFTMIQEFIAAAVGVPMGRYFTVSNNLHIYTELYDANNHLALPPDDYDYDAYKHGIGPWNIINSSSWETWLHDAASFCDAPFARPYKPYHPFFTEVAYPMAMVSHTRKNKTGDGRDWANKIVADDWRLATLQWIDRRDGQRSLFG